MPSFAEVGVSVGFAAVGGVVGLNDGAADGIKVGSLELNCWAAVGVSVGTALFNSVGAREGVGLGGYVGLLEGASVGTVDENSSSEVGTSEGRNVGQFDGK